MADPDFFFLISKRCCIYHRPVNQPPPPHRDRFGLTPPLLLGYPLLPVILFCMFPLMQSDIISCLLLVLPGQKGKLQQFMVLHHLQQLPLYMALI